MSQLNDTLLKVKSEELLSRFRSKDDLYRYMTQQSKKIYQNITQYIVGLFLPSFKGIKLNFIRAILSNQKKALHTKDITMITVPRYEELSVKNLYDEALQDQQVRDYLPELQMNSNRLPERNFFFGILGTLKRDYVLRIIEDANMNRYQESENQGNQDYIAIQQNWYNELIKYPFISIFIEKPGKAIFLIKQRSKLIRKKKMYHKFDLSQKLSQSIEEEEKDYIETYNINPKRQKTQNFQVNTFNQSQESSMNNSMQFNI